MKKQKTVKKLCLNKETLKKLELEKVTGGLYQIDQQISDGPEQCWFSECASC